MYRAANIRRQKQSLQRKLEKVIDRNRLYGKKIVDPEEIDLKHRIDLLDLQLQKQ